MLPYLYGLLIAFRTYVLAGILVSVSIGLMALNDNPQVRVIRSAVTISVSLIQDQLLFIPRYFNLAEENVALRRLNMDLADEVNLLREAKLENFRLRRLLELKETSASEYVVSRVVGRNDNLLRRALTLDAGSNDGIAPRMTVVNERGLVGVISDVTPNFSIATLVTNVRFRASAKVQRTRVNGIIAWDGKDLHLNNVAKTLDVKPGDVVVTSEYSSTFPPNIRIGVVSSVEEMPGSLFRMIKVIPSVDFLRLEEVFITLSVPSTEKEFLENSVPR